MFEIKKTNLLLLPKILKSIKFYYKFMIHYFANSASLIAKVTSHHLFFLIFPNFSFYNDAWFISELKILVSVNYTAKAELNNFLTVSTKILSLRLLVCFIEKKNNILHLIERYLLQSS